MTTNALPPPTAFAEAESPAGQPHTHAAVEDAVLFRVSDEPVMSRLGFLRVAD